MPATQPVKSTNKTGPLKYLSLAAILFVSYLLLFVIPFYVPLHTIVASESYIMGFNNKIAVLGVYLSLFLFFIWTICFKNISELSAADKMLSDKKMTLPSIKNASIIVIMGFYLLVTVAGYFISNTPFYHGEDEQFVRSIELITMGKVCYRDFWFTYGPQIYLPALTYKVFSFAGLTANSAYHLYYAFMMLLSVYLLYWFIERFNFGVGDRRLLFAVTSILSLNLYGHLLYSLLRSIPSFAGLYLIDRLADKSGKKSSARVSTLLILSIVLTIIFNFMLSSEVGVAYLVAVLIYIILRGFNDKKIIFCLIPAILAALIYYSIIPKEAFRDMLDYANGANNFPLVPSPGFLFFLFSVILIVPVLFSQIFSLARRKSALLVSFAVLIILFLNGAVMRCDSLHIFYYGLGVFILTAIHLARTSKIQFRAYISAFIIIYGISLALTYYATSAGKISASLYSLIPKSLISDKQISLLSTRMGLNKQKVTNIRLLSQGMTSSDHDKLSKYRSLASPLIIDNSLRQYLIDTGKFVPEYYYYMVNIDFTNEFERKVEDLNKSNYIIISKLDIENASISLDSKGASRYSSMIMGYPVKYSPKYPVIGYERSFIDYIRSHYKPIERISQYIIFEKTK